MVRKYPGGDLNTEPNPQNSSWGLNFSSAECLSPEGKQAAEQQMDKGTLEVLLLGSAVIEGSADWPFYGELEQSTLVQKKGQGKEGIKMRYESFRARGVAQEDISVIT